MKPPIPVFYTNNFIDGINTLSEKERKAIIYNLEHQNEDDIARVPYYKGSDELGEVILKYFKEFKIGKKNYRIMLEYCADCYPKKEMREYHKCSICDGNDLNRIIVFHMYLRPKAYKHYKFSLPDFDFDSGT